MNLLINVKTDSAPLVRIACTAHAVQAYRLSEMCNGIDFSTAAHVFADEFRIERYDGKHSEDEDRYKVIGAIDGYLTVIVVSYTMRNNEKVIRLISARPALKHERREYYGYY